MSIALSQHTDVIEIAKGVQPKNQAGTLFFSLGLQFRSEPREN